MQAKKPINVRVGGNIQQLREERHYTQEELSEKIGTYETSILPYEDCCTIFVAKHPVTKPNVKVIRHSETKLAEKIDGMVEEAVKRAELIVVG